MRPPFNGKVRVASLIAALAVSGITLGSLAVSEIQFRDAIKRDITRTDFMEAKVNESYDSIRDIRRDIRILLRNQCFVLKALNRSDPLATPAQCDEFLRPPLTDNQ